MNDNISDSHACHKEVKTCEGSVPQTGVQHIANQFFPREQHGEACLASHTCKHQTVVVEHHFSVCKVRAQVVQSSSAIVFMALNFLRTTQPWWHQALCKSHCVTKTVHFYTVQTHLCFPNDFGLSSLCFVAHKRVSVLVQGKKETDHPVRYLVCSRVHFLPFISACSTYQRMLLSCQQHNHFGHWGKHEMNYAKAQDPHFATLPYSRDSRDLMDNLSEKVACGLTLTNYFPSPA